MQAIKSLVGEIKSRGQLTIPKKIREMSHLEEGQVVYIIPVGDSIISTTPVPVRPFQIGGRQ